MFSSDKWFGASADFYPETIDQSLRFEDGDSSYLLRTPSSTGNRKSWTVSFWLKIANTGLTANIISVFQASSNQTVIRFYQDKLYLYDFAGAYLISTNRLFRDTTNWYHILWRFDSTQSTASERIKLYINGTLETDLNDTDYPSLNHDSLWNHTNKHLIGARTDNSTPTPIQRFDGYLAEFNLVDGQALGPESFGETKNGVWIPKNLSSISYGTNGFRLTFADSSSLGDDTSGNTNDFTSSGLASTDVCTDSPTNNFCTLNNLQQRSNSLASFSEGNLKAVGTSASASGIMTGTFGVSSGKWYWEVRASDSAVFWNLGVCFTPFFTAGTADTGYYSNEYVYVYTGVKNNNASSSAYGASYTTGDIIGVALDLDADTITFYKNGSSQGVAYSSLPSGTYLPVFDCYNGSSWILNAGQEGTFVGNETAGGNSDGNGVGNFKYSVPSGHLALCSANLPDSTISPNQSEQADDYFNTALWSGNSSTQDVVVGFQPDWVWLKVRNHTYFHELYDSSRGATLKLRTNNNSAEATQSDGLTDFTATGGGFSLGAGAGGNESGKTYVAWNWKAGGGTTSSNTDGSITSTVQANTDAGFSIVTFTGSSSSSTSFTIGHGLGSVPAMIIAKQRDQASGWAVYHHQLDSSSPQGYNILLHATDARASSSTTWGNTAPTSTVFTTSSGYWGTSAQIVAYCFTEVEGYSKFGSYTGNGSTDGTYIHLGFRPSFIMIKSTDVSATDWQMHDATRSPFNVVNNRVQANVSDAETTNYNLGDFLSNGFKLRQTNNSWNGSGNSYIYMAFAEQPFKFSNAR